MMIKKLSLLLLASFCLAGTALAGPVNVSIDFAYNGNSTETAGFKLYHKLPDGSEVVAVDLTDPEVRSWSGTMDVPSGRSEFTLAAYNADEESGRSTVFPFEYIEPETDGGLPVPTVIIRFN
jgi:hypothetical protein